MRKVLISLAAAASAIAVAAPASAQVWHAPTYRYSPYNYNYNYSGYAFAQSMRARVQQMRYDIRNMESRRILSHREARSLDKQARAIERRIYQAPRGGIRVAEARGIESRIRNLEIRIAREASDWDRRRGHYRRY